MLFAGVTRGRYVTRFLKIAFGDMSGFGWRSA